MSKTEPDPQKPGSAQEGEPRLSRASIGRYSLYLRCVQQLHGEGTRTVSSSQLGEALAITDAQVRKDLAYLGNLGHRGVGYPTQELIEALQAVLGVNRSWPVILVGVGNLARALLRYRGFHQHGFQIVALFDEDASKIGQVVEELEVSAMSQLAEIAQRHGAELAILTVPAEVAQEVANALAGAGIKGILNFAPIVLRLPANMYLVSVDLAVQLEQLASLVHLGTNE
ncbi:MAG: redox-sensing transcriptional repressor Rex [Bdellovibrionales bacterium]